MERWRTPIKNGVRRPIRKWLYSRQLKKQAQQEKAAGVAAIALGILAQGSNSRSERILGHGGIIAGANIFARGIQY